MASDETLGQKHGAKTTATCVMHMRGTPGQRDLC